jgi:hypothetical protein
MESSEFEHYRAVNSIIERDSTFATYKYALLRGAIEICRDYPHLKREEEGQVFFPLGLLIEKWLLYYYPIIASERFIPQQSGERADGGSQISFRKYFSRVTDFYRDVGGYSQWYSDYRTRRIPDIIRSDFIELCKKIRTTITTMPMYHLGYSQYQEPYSVLNYSRNRHRIPKDSIPDPEFLITQFGEFYFTRKDIFEVFSVFGGYMTGETTILQKWAQATHRMDQSVSTGKMISLLTRYPVEERNIQAGDSFCAYLRAHDYPVTCIWSGRLLGTRDYHIDHLLPFSICKNNDLWNLMPAYRPVNAQKSDMIPSGRLLEKRKDAIIRNWTLMREFDGETFLREMRISLIGPEFQEETWQEIAFSRLRDRCRFMTGVLGYEEWDGP